MVKIKVQNCKDKVYWHNFNGIKQATKIWVRIKGLKLRRNSDWTGNCSGELRPLQEVPRRLSRIAPGYTTGYLYPDAFLLWRQGTYCGAAVDERRGTKNPEEFESCTPALFYYGARVEIVYPGAVVEERWCTQGSFLFHCVTLLLWCRGRRGCRRTLSCFIRSLYNVLTF